MSISQVSQYCGAFVKKCQVIGLSGSSGNSSGPHLHFEAHVPGGYLNPLKVLPNLQKIHFVFDQEEE